MKNIAVATLFVILCIVISVVYGAEMAPCTKHSDCSKRELCFTAGGGKRSNGICSKKTMVEVGELAQQASFDPNYESFPLEYFEPMVKRIFAKPIHDF